MTPKWFDNEVRARRAYTPWAEISLVQFVRDVMMNEPASEQDSPGFSLTCDYDHRQCTREWWCLRWTAADGKERRVTSQRYDLLLWRAAHTEAEVRAKLKRQRELEKDCPWRHDKFEGGDGI